jgi:exosortase
MATTPTPPVPFQRLASGEASSGLIALLRSALSRPEQRPVLAGAVGCLALLALIFESNLHHFAVVWSNDGNYSHGFLVPLISLYFASLAAQRGPVAVRSGIGLGLGLLAVSMLGRLATILIPVGVVGDLSFLLGLAGICAVLFGRDALKRYWFAFFFLVFMIPLPVALYAQIASPLQLLVSQVATEVLNTTGVPVLREGNMMTLPGGVRMFVAEACSGMRQLTGFLALTVAVAYLSPRPPWYRLAVIASAVPIALTANVARVVLTGCIMRFNPEYASGAYHTAEGLLMMGFGLALLRAECWIMDQLIALGGPAAPPMVPPALTRREAMASGGASALTRPAGTLSQREREGCAAAERLVLAPARDETPQAPSPPEVLEGLSRNEQGRLLEQGWTI